MDVFILFLLTMHFAFPGDDNSEQQVVSWQLVLSARALLLDPASSAINISQL